MPGAGGREGDGYGDRELADALGLHTTPREVSYVAVVLGVVVVGALATFLVWSVAALPRSVSVSAEPELARAELSTAEELFRRGQFAEAQAAFDALAAAHPENTRVRDYLARLSQVDADAALLAGARTKLALGDPQEALAETRNIAPNSPLHADAWAIARSAQDELTRLARERERAERDAQALAAARSIEAPLADATPRGERRARAGERKLAKKPAKRGRNAAAAP